MHAVVARSTLHDIEQARSWLAEGAIPMLRGMDGFVGGQWVRLDESHGTSMVTFESEEQAQAALERIRANAPEGALTIESIQIGEVVQRV